MKIIEPKNPNVSTLTSSSIAESTVSLWDNSTAYNIGDEARRFVDGAYHVYECLIATTGDDPADSPVDSNGDPYWLDTGATNRWAMFDGSVNNASTDSADIVVEYTPGMVINSLAVFNVVGASVTVDVTSSSAGGSIYSETRSTTGNRGPGWYQYLFGEVNALTRFTFFGIPPYADMVITVTVTLSSGTAEIGELVFGTEFVIGTDELGMEPSLKSYSTNEFNSTFGYNTLVVRQSRRRLRTSVAIDSARADIVFRKMESLLDAKMVWISDKFESGQIYGFYSEFAPVHSTHPLVFARLKIEGLI